MEERKKDATMKFYQTELAKMFSNNDFGRFFPDVQSKIIRYADLSKYNTIYELLPDDDYKIILIESKKNSGHWTCLMRNGNTLTFFDSYGFYPDKELNFVSKMANKLLGNKYDSIQKLMNTFNGKKMYSKTKYQVTRDDINTCGRWVCVAIHLIFQLKNSLGEMKKILDTEKKKTGRPYDLIAVNFTT